MHTVWEDELKSFRTSRIVLALVTSICFSVGDNRVVAQSYDDPAIAICELTAVGDQLQNPRYKRVSAEVNRVFASIIYEIAVLNMAPETRLTECRYRLSADGFVLDLAKTKEERACQQAGADWRVIGSTLDHQSEDMILMTVMCEPAMETVTSRERDAELLLKQVIDAGLYPIAPANTSLHVDR